MRIFHPSVVQLLTVGLLALGVGALSSEAAAHASSSSNSIEQCTIQYHECLASGISQAECEVQYDRCTGE
jgi:hypothetical protein